MRCGVWAASLPPCLLLRQRVRPEERRRAENVPPRQSAERLDPRGIDQLDGDPVHVAVQQPGPLRPGQTARTARKPSCPTSPSRGLERRQQGHHLRLQEGGSGTTASRSPPKDVVRHDGPADRQGPRICAATAPVLVRQRRQHDGQRRPRGDDPSQAAAAVDPVAARLGLFADLSLPRSGGADAPSRSAPGRSVRRVQAERGHQDRQEPGLLEGQALSRRHRVHHRSQSCDGDAELPVDRFDITFPGR